MVAVLEVAIPIDLTNGRRLPVGDEEPDYPVFNGEDLPGPHVPLAALRDRRLSLEAKAVYAGLCWLEQEGRVSDARTWLEQLGLGAVRLGATINELHRVGYLAQQGNDVYLLPLGVL